MVFKAIRIISCKKVNMVRAQCSVPTLCDCLMSPSANHALGASLHLLYLKTKLQQKNDLQCFTYRFIDFGGFEDRALRGHKVQLQARVSDTPGAPLLAACGRCV